MNTPNLFPEGFKRALSALYRHAPLTEEERQEHRRMVAAQAARDEALRKPSPQIPLAMTAGKDQSNA